MHLYDQINGSNYGEIYDRMHIWISTGWMKINGSDSALIRASLITEDTTHDCIGTVVVKRGCWSFLKGGFVLTAPSNLSKIYFQVDVYVCVRVIKMHTCSPI